LKQGAEEWYHDGIMKTITESRENGVLHRMLDPFSECLTPAMARRIAKFRADAQTQARVDELATKCSEGDLSPAERREYAAYVQAINLISILQSKARLVLAKNRKSR
jgi:hypothetical protein